MDYQKFIDATVAVDPALVSFDEKIYWLSAIGDGLRDNVKDLLELAGDATTISPRLRDSLTGRYDRIRTETADLLADDVETASKFLSWTTALPDDATGDEIYEAACNLTRAIDVILQVPAFVATRASQRSDIRGVLTKLGATSQTGEKDSDGDGQYL